MRVVVVGQGYVGLPVAVRAAEAGHQVVGYDVDEERIKRLAVGESYVEDIPPERLLAVLDSGAYRPGIDPRDCAGFDIAVISVPTPLRDGVPDLSFIEASARMLARYLRPGATVVLESTTYPGTRRSCSGRSCWRARGSRRGRSTRRTCRGGSSARWAAASASSSWPTTSTATCRTTWYAGSPKASTGGEDR